MVTGLLLYFMIAREQTAKETTVALIEENVGRALTLVKHPLAKGFLGKKENDLFEYTERLGNENLLVNHVASVKNFPFQNGLILINDDGDILVFQNSENIEFLATTRTFDHIVYVDISPDGSTLSILMRRSRKSELEVWNIATKTMIYNNRIALEYPTSLVSLGKNQIAVLGYPEDILVIDYKNNDEHFVHVKHPKFSSRKTLYLDSDGKGFAVQPCGGSEFFLFRADDLEHPKVLKLNANPSSCKMNSLGNVIAIGTETNRRTFCSYIYLVDPLSREVIFEKALKATDIHDVEFLPDSSIVTSHDDGRLIKTPVKGLIDPKFFPVEK